MSKSPYKRREAGSLKEASSDLIVACGGGHRAADLGRVGKATLFRYTDDSEENVDRYMPVDVVRALESHCGDPVVTRFLASEAGAVLLPLPSLPQGGGDWSVRLADLAKETSDVFAKFAAILADGEITRREAGEAIRELDDVLGKGGSIRAALRRIANGEAA